MQTSAAATHSSSANGTAEPLPDTVRGLINTGNTCFLNAVLQALAPAPPVHEWLRNILLVSLVVSRRHAMQRAMATAVAARREARRADASGSATSSSSGSEEDGSAASAAATADDSDDTVEWRTPVKPHVAAEAELGSSAIAAKLLGLLRALSAGYHTHSLTHNSSGGAGSASGSGSNVLGKLASSALSGLHTAAAVVGAVAGGGVSVGTPPPLHPHLGLADIHTAFTGATGLQHDAHELLMLMLLTLDDDELSRMLTTAAADRCRQRQLSLLLSPRVAPSTVPKRQTVDGKKNRASFAAAIAHATVARLHSGAASTVTLSAPEAGGAPRDGSGLASLAAGLTNPFACGVARRTECIACHQLGDGSRMSYQPPWQLAAESGLTLALPEPMEHLHRLHSAAGMRGPPPPSTSIEALLRSYFSSSPVSDWMCDNPACSHIAYGVHPVSRRRVPVDDNAMRRCVLVAPPSLLMLHVNRLQAGYKHGLHVDFDAVLDVRPFMMPTERSHSSGGGSTGGSGSNSDSSSSSRYVLVSVVVHLGGPASGHYVTYRRLPAPATSTAAAPAAAPAASSARAPGSAWVETSDTSVRPCTWTEVKRCQAYMLLYVREDVRSGASSSSGGALVGSCREPPASGGVWPRVLQKVCEAPVTSVQSHAARAGSGTADASAGSDNSEFSKPSAGGTAPAAAAASPTSSSALVEDRDDAVQVLQQLGDSGDDDATAVAWLLKHPAQLAAEGDTYKGGGVSYVR